MKKDTFYFSHDYNSANDTKILFLRQQLGMEGYGIYWYIIEQLAQSGGFLPIKIIPVLAMQMQTTETKVLGVIKNFELFCFYEKSENKENQFYSERLNKHLEVRKSLSEKGKEGALKRWENKESYSHPISHPISDPNAKERKGKEIKENKIKENKRKENKFSFKNSLLEFSSNKQLIDDWLLVRKNKKATNTQTAFNSFIQQVKISDIKIDEILKICVEKSWSGYKFEWILNERKKVAPKKESNLLNNQVTNRP